MIDLELQKQYQTALDERRCSLPPDVARKILAARDAHTAGDYQEVYHQLYSIADPEFTSFEPWAALERIAANA